MLSARSRRGEDGIVGVNLTVILVFVLFAVVELTRTTVAAQQINVKVKEITKSVSSAEVHLRTDPLLDKVDRNAEAILVAAKPLSGQADQIIAAAKSIDGTASQIQSTAQSINGVVKQINGTVLSIGNSARSINSTVHSIDATFVTLNPLVVTIKDGVAAINMRADRIIAPVRGIETDLANTNNLVGNKSLPAKTIDAHANSIDCSVLVAGQSCNK